MHGSSPIMVNTLSVDLHVIPAADWASVYFLNWCDDITNIEWIFL